MIKSDPPAKDSVTASEECKYLVVNKSFTLSLYLIYNKSQHRKHGKHGVQVFIPAAEIMLEEDITLV
jgi:hypothetical protein